MADGGGHSVPCTVAAVDIVGLAAANDAEKQAMQSRLVDLLDEALSPIEEEGRLIEHAEGGAVIYLFGDPEVAIYVTTVIHELAQELKPSERIALRTGVDFGRVDRARGSGPTGDVKATAASVMQLAQAGEILASAAYRDAVVEEHTANKVHFRHLGAKSDPAGRELEVHALGYYSWDLDLEVQAGATPTAGIADEGATVIIPPPGEAPPADKDAKPKKPAGERPRKSRALSGPQLKNAEAQLTEIIGPLAKLLVRKAAEKAANYRDLYIQLSEHITNDADRERFLADIRTTRKTETFEPATKAPAAERPRSVAADTPQWARTAEPQLAEFIGPLAKLLVKKEAAQCSNLGELYERLAKHISDDAERERFLAGRD